jgi:hypothetical protein
MGNQCCGAPADETIVNHEVINTKGSQHKRNQSLQIKKQIFVNENDFMKLDSND